MFDRFLMAGRNRIMQGALLKLQSAYDGLKIVEQAAQAQIKELKAEVKWLTESAEVLAVDNMRLSNDLANRVWAYGIEREAQRKVDEVCCPCGKFICPNDKLAYAERPCMQKTKPRQRVFYYVDTKLSPQWVYVYATNIKDLGEHRNGHVMRCQNTEAGRAVANEFVEYMNKQAQVK